MKLLGIDFDNKLQMGSATHKCATKAALKTRALLRSRRFYNHVDLIMLYKSHVLSYIEYRTAGIHFATTSVLIELDDVQSRFLRQLDLSEESALMDFNLAPLNVRRDIAILGVIHRAVLHQGPPCLWRFFRRAEDHNRRSSSRRTRHSLQLAEWPRERDLEIMRRSALGMIRVYNLLPEPVVKSKELKSFQRGLSELVKDRVRSGDRDWRHLLSTRYRLFQSHPLSRR